MTLSTDGTFLAFGGPEDDDGIGATWVFLFNGSSYEQLGNKLIGADSERLPYQGKRCNGTSFRVYISLHPSH